MLNISNAKKLIAVLIAVAMTAVFIAGCGTPQEVATTAAPTTAATTTVAETTAAETTTEAETTTTTAAPTTTSVAAKLETATTTAEETTTDEPAGPSGSAGGNILRWGTTGIDNRFNPVMCDNLYDSDICGLIFESLIENDASGVPHPTNLNSKMWELSEDSRTYTFFIKDNIRYTDGTLMTAADIEFTYKVMADPEYDGPRSYAVSGMVGYEAYSNGETDIFEGVQVIDEHTISFTFEYASPANVWDCGYGIMPMHYYAFTSWEGFLALLDKPLGSGLFILDTYEPNQYWALDTNPDYWDPANGVSIDGVLITHVPTESLIGALQTDQLDFFQHGMVTLDTVAMIDGMEGASTHIYRSNGYIHLQFNTKKPQLSDVRVRQALMYALDRKSFVEIQYGEGLAEVAPSVFSPVSWATPPVGTLNMYDFDLAKAEELMNEAGWFKGTDGMLEKDGEKFQLTWYVYEDAPWPGTLAGIAADHWKQLGVDLTIELMDFVTTIARTTSLPFDERTFDIYTMGFSLAIDPDPSGALWDPDAWTIGGFNGSGYDSERARELITLGKNSFDQAERESYYQEFAKLLNEDVPGTLLAYRSELWGISDRVSGMKAIGPFLRWAAPVVLRGITLN